VGNTATHHAYYIGAAPSIHVDPGSASLSLSTWYHTAATWDGATLTTYVNGALDGTASGSGSLGGNAGHSTAIGWDEATPGRNFNGSIGECCIWSVALSASEVLALAKGARPFNVRPLSILGGWSLDGLASPEPDFSGNKNNGTLTGTALAFGPPLMQFTPRWPQFAPFDVFVFNLMPQIIW
jgi:hypothetical protein